VEGYVQWDKDNGMDECHLTLSLTDAFMKGTEAAAELRSGKQVIKIQLKSVFSIRPQKPGSKP
jgi:hypothetical protein